MRPLADVAAELGLAADDVIPWGPGAAKVDLRAIGAPRGKLVLVTATTPTSPGEGKTVTAIGLADGLRLEGARAAVVLRQPATGPLFGRKGGGSGGGRAALVPQHEVDLHFTGDLHAVAAAQGLVAAMTDDHLHQGNALGIDPARVCYPRAIDLNDRALRRVVTGIGAASNGPAREGMFVSTAACETMAVLALAQGPRDLKERLGRMVVGFTAEGASIPASAVGAHGPAAALMAHALKPNLVQTTGGAPAFVHAGPFANVSHGTSSVLAARLALSRCDVVVKEAGFASELGAEKFVDLVGPQSGLRPDLAVLVTSVRALAATGASNLDAHLDILDRLGLRAVVAVNRFAGDTDGEVEAIVARCAARGVAAVAHTAFRDGPPGARALARAVLDALARGGSRPAPVYASGIDPLEALDAIATRVYGADGVDLLPSAARDLERLRRAGHGHLPVCVAKTPYSLSHDAELGATPRGWRLPVRELRVAAGAGYLVAIAGDILLLPGLGKDAAARRFDLADDGTVVFPSA